MNDQIKNRVVGTVVVFTLAIIFLPDIFDGKKNELKEEFAVIPARPAPVKQQDVIKVSEPVVDVNQTKPSQAVNKPVVSKDDTKKHVTKSQSETFKRAGWVIQMGIFKEVSRVKPYLAKLRKQGYTAFSVPQNPRAGEPTTVYVGPHLDKSVLAKMQPKLKKSFNESGYIKKFNPLSYHGK